MSKCMFGQVAIYNLWSYHAYQTVWYTSLNQYTTLSAHHLNAGLNLTTLLRQSSLWRLNNFNCQDFNNSSLLTCTYNQ